MGLIDHSPSSRRTSPTCDTSKREPSHFRIALRVVRTHRFVATRIRGALGMQEAYWDQVAHMAQYRFAVITRATAETLLKVGEPSRGASDGELTVLALPQAPGCGIKSMRPFVNTYGVLSPCIHVRSWRSPQQRPIG